MFSFTDGARAYHMEMRALATDALGCEILVGLTYEETGWYLSYLRGRLNGSDRGPDDGRNYLRLLEKHERARLQVLSAEIEARNDNPTRH